MILKMKTIMKESQIEQILIKERRKKLRNKKEVKNINQNNSMIFFLKFFM
jgi:hypothetical protein